MVARADLCIDAFEKDHGRVSITFHQRALDAPAGNHTITVVDNQGHRLSRQFEVLARDGQ